jgi:hypothetical protein
VCTISTFSSMKEVIRDESTFSILAIMISIALVFKDECSLG